MLKLFEDKLQSALNCYLALDPESTPKLAELNNTAITIELQGINITFQLQFKHEKVYIKFSDFVTPDTLIKSMPISMAHMALAKENRKKFFEKGTIIEGNVELGLSIISLFDELDIDWEEYIASIIGDVPAHELSRAMHHIKQFGKRLGLTLTQSTNEYLHEETRLFPPPEELADFFDDIDQLRMDTDRLEAKIAQLENKIKNQETS